tara:strand:- start:654 stop:857 length:204 start_codon:yes stop_codon:yes gene_type:complete
MPNPKPNWTVGEVYKREDLNTHDPHNMYAWAKRPFIIRSFLHFLGFIAGGVGLVIVFWWMAVVILGS